ncbi:hypothetical protein BS78_10G220900 [Paspalum vaginatum]|nr:hypothetical protein BS78_10G220900 [Paspalum vaginatum]
MEKRGLPGVSSSSPTSRLALRLRPRRRQPAHPRRSSRDHALSAQPLLRTALKSHASVAVVVDSSTSSLVLRVRLGATASLDVRSLAAHDVDGAAAREGVPGGRAVGSGAAARVEDASAGTTSAPVAHASEGGRGTAAMEAAALAHAASAPAVNAADGECDVGLCGVGSDAHGVGPGGERGGGRARNVGPSGSRVGWWARHDGNVLPARTMLQVEARGASPWLLRVPQPWLARRSRAPAPPCAAVLPSAAARATAMASTPHPSPALPCAAELPPGTGCCTAHAAAFTLALLPRSPRFLLHTLRSRCRPSPATPPPDDRPKPSRTGP